MSLIIKDVSFLSAATHPKGYPPPGPPEVAFAGRSNVGKSSLINCLVRRKKLVRVSSRPGRTQQINFFSVNQGQFHLVDLPGYGFAKVPLKVKAGWKQMVESYLSSRETLRAVVVIIDLRHDPTGEDMMLLEYLRAMGIPTIVAATKADKLSGNKRSVRINKLKPRLKLFDPSFVPVSAMSGLGREKMWERLVDLMDLDQPQPDGEPGQV